MTDGIVSAINRDLTVNDRTMSLIQTNAALNNGKLADISPTLLDLLGIKQPAEMTGKSLLVRK